MSSPVWVLMELWMTESMHDVFEGELGRVGRRSGICSLRPPSSPSAQGNREGFSESEPYPSELTDDGFKAYLEDLRRETRTFAMTHLPCNLICTQTGACEGSGLAGEAWKIRNVFVGDHSLPTPAKLSEW
ncbi:hypothetical protein V5O48_011645 [Marasmius crinis-equi]|uniref:Uncharacterized protein n=1 Tax=Marasmius crinis-equi TaxID=585013 RepID=A0ABR3F5F0_9AGAR